VPARTSDASRHKPHGKLGVEHPRLEDARADVATAQVLERDAELVGLVDHDADRRMRRPRSTRDRYPGEQPGPAI
jgi:hypothetical protein